MRPFELAMIGLLVVSALACLRKPTRRWMPSVLAGSCGLALVLHLVLEGARWQMAPAYLGVLVIVPLLRWRSLWLGCGVLLAAALSLVLGTILPVFTLPAPTGPYPIGTRMLYLVDPTRDNGLAPHSSHGRDIAVQLWYPAAPSRNPLAVYRMLAESTLRSSYMSVVPTHARQDAPVLVGKTPWHVLLFSAAWDNRRGQSTALVEELASQGYVVATMDHPGRTGPVALPDGRLLPVIADPEVDDLAHSTVERVEAGVSVEVDKEAADTSFVLDQLELLNQNPGSPLYQRLDTKHAGAFGHSLGGAVAGDVCALDPRVLSAMSMSAPFFGKVRTMGLDKPFLSIFEEVHLASPAQMQQMDYGSRVDAETDVLDTADFNRLIRAHGGYDIILRGINHSSFTDTAFYSPLRRLSGEGATPRDRVQFILREYAVQFFGMTLEGKPAPLLDGASATPSSPFPEVTQRYYRP